ncbi:MAG: PAS domain S-box protein [Synechococcales cyanobacterium C42_A2020_086]|jgi:PAS domain S-box-containing protein|nr:PAS domain S-box protein [Synechococcales cyanobacterium C42_A2020_086]
MKILIVEDDQTVAQTLQILLSSYNYAVDIATDGDAGLQMAEAFDYDLIVLDIALPKLDGISLCQQLRHQGFQRSILVLTGQGNAQQKAIALNAGADDYVVKPFDSEELVARIQALLRRGSSTTQPILTWGLLSLDPSSRKVSYGTDLLTVTSKEYAILELLLRHPDRIFSASKILDQVWNSIDVSSEAAVRGHIKELRRKLAAAGAPKDLIKTVYQSGYRLNPLYASGLAHPAEHQPTPPQPAELTAVNQELRAALDKLRSTQAELRQKHQELQLAYQTIAQERQCLQATHDDLEQRVAERTAELAAANQALQQQQQHWQTLVENSPDIIFRLDLQLRHLYISPRVAEVSGLPPQHFLGKTGRELGLPADACDAFEAACRAAIATGEITRVEYTIADRHYASRLIPERSAAGAIESLLGITEDITERQSIETEYKCMEAALQQQLARMRLITETSHFIRQTLDLDQVLQRTVDQIRQLLQVNRTLIFRFQPDWRCTAVAESVEPGWTPILATTISDPCFRDQYIEPYRQGRVSAIADLETAALQPCYRDLLASFQVRANLVVPILQSNPPQDDHLWGLLVVHHCAGPRPWQAEELELLRQLANQVGIAIQQSELYQQAHHELLERRRMQQVLQDSEERFRSLSASAPIGIRQSNADGICLYVNARWQEMSGLSLEDSLGNGWLQAIHPDDREATAQAWETYVRQGAQQGKELKQKVRLLTPQGEVRWIFCQTAPIRSSSGEITGYVSTQEDITARKQAEQTIREQAALLDIASDAIFVRDLNHRILYWNQGAERLYGWSAAEAVGQNARELLQEDSTQMAAVLQRVLEQGEWQGEMRKVTRTGREVMIAGRWTLVRDEAGHPTSILSVNTDITEKKQLEAQFYRAQRLESIGTLASGIAHDLNNVLTPILALSQLLRLKLQLDAHSREMLEILAESAKRGANLVKQILTFARGSEGTQIPLQVGPLLHEIATIARQTFPKSISIHDVSSPSLGWVVADPTHLHQVLMNLCVNARDAMPNGGTLTLEAQNQFVDAEMAAMHLDAKVGNYVVITVADTGTGIAPEVLDRIFDPFFTTKAPGHGTGLGLSTVLGIVKSSGGFVDVQSQLGVGSQFKLYLPAIEAVDPTSEQPTNLLSGQGECILVVDDEPMILQSMQAVLTSYHYRVLTASSCADAIACYRKQHEQIHVVVIDMMMPDGDGLETIRALQAINPQVQIIATSGLVGNYRQSLQALGVTTLLPKPFVTVELLQGIQSHIRQHTQQYMPQNTSA